MSKYNFDQIIDRKETHANKIDSLKDRFGRSDLISLWVADMDFKSPDAIIDAIIERAKHGVFGYTGASDNYYQSIINWVDRKHNWKINKEEISFIPGVVKGIAFIIDAFTDKNSKIIIQPPVYHPFHFIPKWHQREVVENPLIFDGKSYKMDFDNLEKIIDKDCKLLILCNPHNPGGMIWKKKELEKLSSICKKNNILIISDEIHSDLALQDNKHIPFASISEEAAQNCITLMAPSKTFNIAGIISSFSVIKNKEIRNKFHQFLKISELEQGHIFAYAATEAAYTKCDEWLEELKKYIWDNICFVEEFLKENIPQIKTIKPQASFLVWLDCRELNMAQKELEDLFINKAKLALNNGEMFGKEGKGFMRLNVGSPKSVLKKALNQLNESLK